MRSDPPLLYELNEDSALAVPVSSDEFTGEADFQSPKPMETELENKSLNFEDDKIAQKPHTVDQKPQSRAREVKAQEKIQSRESEN